MPQRSGPFQRVRMAKTSQNWVRAQKIRFQRIDPNNRLNLSQDVFHTFASWAFLLYDLLHIFVIVVFALVLAQTFSWEAWMGGGHPLFHLWQTSHH